jgi:hypothetical protein
VRGDVRRRRVDDLAEVAERQLADSSRVLSASNAPQPPSLTGHPDRPGRPRSARACTRRVGVPARPAQREHDLGGVVDVRVAVVGELERPAAGASRAGVPPSHRRRDLLAEQPVGAPRTAGSAPARRRRAARSAPARCPRPATGTPPASAPARPARDAAVAAGPESSGPVGRGHGTRRPDGERVEPGQPGRIRPSPAGARAAAARSASRPTAAGCRPRTRRPPAGRGSSARPAHRVRRAAAGPGAARTP